MDALEHCLGSALTPQVTLSWRTALRTLIAVEAPLVDMVVAGRALDSSKWRVPLQQSPVTTSRVTAALQCVVEKAVSESKSSSFHMSQRSGRFRRDAPLSVVAWEPEAKPLPDETNCIRDFSID